MQSAPTTYPVHATLGKGWTGWKTATVTVDPATGITVRTAKGEATATADTAGLDIEPFAGNLVLAEPDGPILATVTFSSARFMQQDFAVVGLIALLLIA